MCSPVFPRAQLKRLGPRYPPPHRTPFGRSVYPGAPPFFLPVRLLLAVPRRRFPGVRVGIVGSLAARDAAVLARGSALLRGRGLLLLLVRGHPLRVLAGDPVELLILGLALPLGAVRGVVRGRCLVRGLGRIGPRRGSIVRARMTGRRAVVGPPALGCRGRADL